MSEITYKAKGFLGEESECCPCALSFKNKDGFTAVYTEADAGDRFFNSELAVKISVSGIAEGTEYVSVNRYAEFWCRPNFGNDLSLCPPDTQALILKNKDGSFTVLLPVCGEEYKCTLEGCDGELCAKVYSWYAGLSKCNTLAFVVGSGEDPYVLMHDLTKFAVECLGNYVKMREDRPYPEIFEYLGWCSWDAFQIRVTERDLVEKCREFRDKDIPVKWAIIDDMWADVKNFVGKKYNTRGEMFNLMHSSPLDSFNAAPERFPLGLGHCIAEMNKFGITVGMWHPTTGYWKGIAENGQIFNEHRSCLIEREKEGKTRYIHGITEEQAFEFYDSFHKTLSDAGAKFMKVDNQSCIRSWYKGLAPVGTIARNLHKSIEKSVYKYFNGDLINCMGMAEENIWNRPDTAISRCSGDFQPENRPWFINHILQCSYNSLYQGQLIWCDWDMWWSDDGQGIKNSVVRAISGGPIYVSDTAKRSKASVLKPLCLYDGRILRTDFPAVPTVDCLTVDPEGSREAFKIFSKCDDTYMVAAFDINAKNVPVSVNFGLAELKAEKKADKYLVYEHFSGKYDVIDAENGKFTSGLSDQDDFRLYTVAPVSDSFALVGLSDKFIGTRACEKVSPDGCTILEGGEFVFYSEKNVKAVTFDGKPVILYRNGNLYKAKAPCRKAAVEVRILYN